MISSALYTIVVFFHSLALLHFFRIAFTLEFPQRKSIVYILLGLYALLTSYTLSNSYANLSSKVLADIIAIFYFSARIWLYFLIFRCVNAKMALLSILSLFIDQIFSSSLALVIPISDINNYILSRLIVTIILISCINMIKRHNLTDFLTKYIRKIKIYIYLLSIVTMGLISGLVEAATFSRPNERTVIIIQGCTILLVIILSIVVSSIVKIAISEQEKKELSELLSKQIENQVGYYEKINEIYDEFRSFRHDFQNHILCLQSILDANDVEQAQEYLSSLVDRSSGTKPKYNTGSVIIDALLNDKSTAAEKQNISIEFTGYVPTTGIHNIDLCTIFANAIDNAIEACRKSNSTEDKYIRICSDFRQGYYFLTITNPIFETIQLEKGRIITSKKNKTLHGYGLANIIKAVKKYNGDTNISTQDNYFSLDITLLLDATII